MITIYFEAHGTTLDNQQKISSGWNDVPLSPLGEQQARKLGERYAHKHIDAVFCSRPAASIRNRTAGVRRHHAHYSGCALT